MRIIIFLSFVLFGMTSLACPLGAQESKLGIQRVMMNFNKYTFQADSTVTKGSQGADQVSDQDLDQSVADLQIVISCIDAELTTQDLDMFPAKAKKLSGQEQIDFILTFTDLMAKLKPLTLSYAEEFKTLRAQAAADRNFASAKAAKKAFNDFIDDAHMQF